MILKGHSSYCGTLMVIGTFPSREDLGGKDAMFSNAFVSSLESRVDLIHAAASSPSAHANDLPCPVGLRKLKRGHVSFVTSKSICFD